MKLTGKFIHPFSLGRGHVIHLIVRKTKARFRLLACSCTLSTILLLNPCKLLIISTVLHRSHLVAQLIFLDQLCEISPYLPRSSLEPHVPYAILRSIYSQYYENSPSTPLALLSGSPRHSPAASLSHSSPGVRHPRGDSTPQYDSSYFKGSSSHSQEHETDSGSLRSTESRLRNVRRSGPLDYSSSRSKVKFVEGSTSGSTGPSPLPRFAVSRSGPISYK